MVGILLRAAGPMSRSRRVSKNGSAAITSPSAGVVANVAKAASIWPSVLAFSTESCTPFARAAS